MSKSWKPVGGELTFEQALEQVANKAIPQQLQFFSAANLAAALVGGQGCVAAETTIAGVPIAEWQGGSNPYLSPAYLKGSADLYRVTTQSGRQVVVTAGHRFLTPTGWNRLADLCVGSLIAADGNAHAGLGLEKPSSSPAYCSQVPHLRDVLPHPAQAAFLHKWRRLRSFGVDSSAWEIYDHLSIENSFARVGQPSVSSPLFVAKRVVRPPRSELRENHVEYPSTFPLIDTERQFPHTVVASPEAVPSAIYCFSSTSQSLSWPYDVTFWDKIQAISYVNHGQFYDLTVPGLEHYSANGLWHHNSGKTVILCLHAMVNAMRDPSGFTLIGRLNYPALINSTMKTFLEIVPERFGTFQPTSRTFSFVNGHELVFHHLDITDPKVAGPIKSMNLSAAYVDEATEISEDTYLLITGRVRRRTAPMHFIRLCSNPAGHDWVWRYFFDPNRRPAFLNNLGITVSTFDNPLLPPDIVENWRNTYPEDWAARYLHGSFTDFSDLVYKEFAEPTHTWDAKQQHAVFGGLSDPPAEWPVIIGIDIGSDTEHDPWAIVLVAVAPDGRLYQFDEIFGNGLLIAEIADQLFDKLGQRTRPDVAYDYAQRQCALELAEYDIHGTPAIKEVEPGIFKTAQYVHVDARLLHPFSGKEGSPRYFISSKCRSTIDELASYKWAKDRSGNATGKPAHEHSHIPDAIRYAIHTFRPLPDKPKPKELWEAEGLSELSRAFWRSEACKEKERDSQGPILRFKRAHQDLFRRRGVLRSRGGSHVVPR